ncbi:MAG: hypothetical protein ABMA26_06305 [Limisphaerales bacterium]
MSKPWDKPSGGRRAPGTQARRRVLIICEDSKSSRYYFEAFKPDPQRAEVVAVGTGTGVEAAEFFALRPDAEAIAAGVAKEESNRLAALAAQRAALRRGRAKRKVQAPVPLPPNVIPLSPAVAKDCQSLADAVACGHGN